MRKQEYFKSVYYQKEAKNLTEIRGDHLNLKVGTCSQGCTSEGLYFVLSMFLHISCVHAFAVRQTIGP